MASASPQLALPRGSALMPAPECPQELWARARALTGTQVAALARACGLPLPSCGRRGKGFVGRIAELALGADPTAGERPDFPHLGIELKTVPVGAAGRPQQSTFVCSINLLDAQRDEWAHSRLRQRLQQVLLLPVQPADGPDPMDMGARTFAAPAWWQPTAADLAALEGDWEDLMGAIGAGRGGCLSAHEGRVLQVRPKAANARVRALGPATDGLQPMLPLGFYLRAGFVGEVLRRPACAAGPHSATR